MNSVDQSRASPRNHGGRHGWLLACKVVNRLQGLSLAFDLFSPLFHSHQECASASNPIPLRSCLTSVFLENAVQLVEECHPHVKHKIGLHREGNSRTRYLLELTVELARPLDEICRDLQLTLV